jgi:diguanylate cyclase (GGDEF)-like protein
VRYGFARIRRPDGETRDVRFRGSMVAVPGSTGGHLLGICQDMTDIRAAERARIEAVERFRSVFERAPVGIALVARGGRLELANEALAEFLGRDRAERGSLWLFGEDGEEGEPALEAAWPRDSARERPVGELVIPVVSGADEIGLLEFACQGVEYGGEDLEAFAATLGAQVGEFLVRKRKEEQRLRQALHDPLTGLPNRVLFFDRLDHAIRRQQREHAPLAVLFLDFDGFKAVNDRFGHAGGDRVLRLAAAAVASTLRAEDTVARFGGDELVVLSEHITDRARAARIAERILETLREPLELGGEQITLSASIGICVAPVEGPTRDELLSTADAAMYQAKAAGPGRYVIAE